MEQKGEVEFFEGLEDSFCCGYIFVNNFGYKFIFDKWFEPKFFDF
jgi:hypothetical protein